MGLDGQKEGYLIGGFFSLAAFFGIWVLSPNGPVLTIDKDGFEYKNLFKSEKIKWSDVKSFGTVSYTHLDVYKRQKLYNRNQLQGLHQDRHRHNPALLSQYRRALHQEY